MTNGARGVDKRGGSKKALTQIRLLILFTLLTLLSQFLSPQCYIHSVIVAKNFIYDIYLFCDHVLCYTLTIQRCARIFDQFDLLFSSHTIPHQMNPCPHSLFVLKVQTRPSWLKRALRGDDVIDDVKRQGKHCGFCIYLFDNSFDQ